MKKYNIIRKSTINLNYGNTLKINQLIDVLTESVRVINLYIDVLWEKEDFSSKFVDFKVDTWLSATMQQNLGKQALEIVKSQRKRKKKTKPIYKKKSIHFDSRFINFLKLDNSFDMWIKFWCLGNKQVITFPSKSHSHINQLLNDGFTQKKACRLRQNKEGLWLDLYFEKEIIQSSKNESIGIDMGYNKLISTSNEKHYGTDLKYYAEKIERKKQGSKGFKRALTERNEYINKEIKKFLNEFDGNTIYLENLKNLFKKKKGMNKIKRWVYSYFITRLEMKSEVVGVQCLKVNPAYTSQTCHMCGHVDKTSRHGEIFDCTSCDNICDADINAGKNILMRGLDSGAYDLRGNLIFNF